MKLSKKFYYDACSLFPTRGLKRIVSGTTLLPYHHLVSDAEVQHVRHLYSYKNIRQFTQDLDYLLKHFRPIAVAEIVEAVRAGKKMPENAFLLSFDDGFREVYDVIAPILISRGVPAIFFVNPAFLDNRRLFYRCKISLIIGELFEKKASPGLLASCTAIMGDTPAGSWESLSARIKQITQRDEDLLDALASRLELSFDEYLIDKQPFMTSEQVKELADQGFSIGGHSWDHPYYHLIPEDEQFGQTIDSCWYVKENFRAPFSLFSFPHSDRPLPQSFFDHFKGSQLAPKENIDVFFGIQNQKWELNNRAVHRFNAERPELSMNRQMNGLLIWIKLTEFLGKNKVKRA